MGEFTGHGRTNDIDFGDYVRIEQFRHVSPNEMYLYKVIGALESNTWVPAPIKYNSKPVTHAGMERVLNVVCCGVSEDTIIRVAQKDCEYAYSSQELRSRRNSKDS